MRETRDILTAWANSRIEKRIGTEYPAQAVCMNGAPLSFDFRNYLTEREAEEVDKAVLLLKQDDALSHCVLISFYINRLSINKQSKLLGKRHDSVDRLLYGAEKFIRARVINIL